MNKISEGLGATVLLAKLHVPLREKFLGNKTDKWSSNHGTWIFPLVMPI